MDNDKIMIARIDERLKAVDEKLDRLINHTEKTNGRITELEKWQSGLKGAMGVFSGVIAAIVTFGSLLLAKLLNL